MKINSILNLIIIFVAISIVPVYGADPIATNDRYLIEQDKFINISAPGVLTNDYDADNDPLSAVLSVTTSHGSLILQGDGSFTYTPDAGFNGKDTFTYFANDGAASNEAMVELIVGKWYILRQDDFEQGWGSFVSGGTDAMIYSGSNSYQGTNSADIQDNSGEVSSFSYMNKMDTSKGYQLKIGFWHKVVGLEYRNTPPLVIGESYSVNQDTTLNIPAPGVLDNDSDIDGDPISAVCVSTTSSGTLILNADGSFSYTPNWLFHGQDSFEYMVYDGDYSDVATTVITVNWINSPPISSPTNYKVYRNHTFNVPEPGVLGNDIDYDSHPLTVSLMSNVTHGTLTLNSDGSFNYTPDLDYIGMDSFEYRAHDGITNGNTVKVDIQVLNMPPIATNDQYLLVRDTILNIPEPGILINDSDGDGNYIIANLLSDVTHGTLTLNTNGSFTYTPDPGFDGKDTFMYAANDGGTNGNIATVDIIVGRWINRRFDDFESGKGNFATVLVTSDAGVYSFSSGTNFAHSGTKCMFIHRQAGTNSSIFYSTDIDLTSVFEVHLEYWFQAKGNDDTTDDFFVQYNTGSSWVNITNLKYSVHYSNNIYYSNKLILERASSSFSEGWNLRFMASMNANDYVYIDDVLLRYFSTNKGPIANRDAYLVITKSNLIVPAPGFLNNDVDEQLDPITASLLTDTAFGDLTLYSNGAFEYTPKSNFNGVDFFTYKGNDGSYDGNSAIVDITVGNWYIITSDDFESGWGNFRSGGEHVSLYTGEIYSHQSNNSVLMVEDFTTETTNCTFLHVNEYNISVFEKLKVAFWYYPSSMDDMSEDFWVQMYDGTNWNMIAQFIWDVHFTNDAFHYGEVIVDKDDYTFTTNMKIRFVIDASGEQDYIYIDEVVVSAFGGNSTPIAVEDTYSFAMNTTLTLSAPGVLSNDIDYNFDPMSAILISDVTTGTLSLYSNGAFNYRPITFYTGSDSFSYKINDGIVDGNTVDVNLNIYWTNTPAYAIDTNYTLFQDTKITIPDPGFMGNDSDYDGDFFYAKLVTDTAKGILTFVSNGAFEYEPNTGYSGTDRFTYRLYDGKDHSTNNATVEITVQWVNTAPIAVDDNYSMMSSTTLYIASPGVLGNDIDPDPQILTAFTNSSTTQGTLTLETNGYFRYIPNPGYIGKDHFTYYVNDSVVDGTTATVEISVNGYLELSCEDFESGWGPFTEAGNSSLLDNGTYANSPTYSVQLVGSSTTPGTFQYTSNMDISTYSELIIDYYCYPRALNSSSEGYFVEYFNGSSWEKVKSNYLGVGGLTNGTLSSNHIVLSRMNYTFPTNMNLRFTIDATGSGDYVYIDDVCIYGLTGMNNLPPIATNNSYIIGRDIVLDIEAPGLLGNDTDPDGDPISAILVNPAAEGTVTINSDGSFTYKPDPHYFGSDSFTYKANDGIDDSNIATVDITIDEWVIITYDDFESGWSNYTSGGGNANVVTSGNAHQGTDCVYVHDNTDSFFYHTDGHDVKDYNKIKVNFWAWSVGMDSGQDTLDLEYFDGSKWVTIKALDPGTDFTNNQFSYVEVLIERLDYGFPEDMKIRIRCDAGGTEGVYIDELKVTGAFINTPPVARDDKYEVNQKKTLDVSAVAPFSEYYYKEMDGVLVNDLDYENEPLTAALVTNVKYGTLELETDGSFIYTPNSNFCGMDYFLYKANDGIDDSDIAKVRIMVYPDFDDWIELTYDTFESGLGNFTTGGADAMPYTGTNSFKGTNCVQVQDDSGTASSFSYISSVDITAYSKLKVELWFKAENFGDGEDFFVRYYDGSTWRIIGDFDAGTDFDNGRFIYKRVIIDNNSSYNFPSNMRIRIESSGSDNFDKLYVDEVRVSVLPKKEGFGLVTLQSWALIDNLTQIINKRNFPDVYSYLPSVRAASNRYTIKNGSMIRGYLHPPFTGTYTFRLIGQRSIGLWISDDDTVNNLDVVIPQTTSAGSYPGATGQVYLVTGNKYYFEVVQQSIAVYNEYIYLSWELPGFIPDSLLEGDWISPFWIVNNPPVAMNDAYSADRNNTLTVSASSGVLEDDYDNNLMAYMYRRFEGDPLNAILVDDVNNGALTLHGDGSFIYTPDNGFTGDDEFHYIIYDGNNYSEPATVDITVGNLNNAPVAIEDRYNMYSNSVLNISGIGVLTNDIDKDGDGLIAILDDDVSYGTLTLNLNGSFTYNPNPGFLGMDKFTYRVNDGITSGNTVTVELWVYDPNAPLCGVLREVWTGLTSAWLNNFTNIASYPDSPNEREYLASYSSPTNYGHNFGERLRGYFIPKVTGSYRFECKKHGTDQADMRIYRSDETSEWKRTSRTGSLIFEKGQKYLIEVIHVDGNGGDDYVYVRWENKLDEQDYIKTISCDYIAPVDVNTPPMVDDKEYMIFRNESFEMDSPGVLHGATDGEDDPIQAIQVSDVSDGTLTFDQDGSFSYTPDTGFTGTDSFTYKANDGNNDSAEKTVTFTVIAGSNSNVKISNWTYTSGSPSATLTSASKLMGFYAFADRAQDVIEIRGIRDELYAKVTASNIQEVMPWADINGPDYGICSVSFVPSGRLLFFGVCSSPDSPNAPPDGKKDAIIRYNVNLKKAYLFETLIIAKEMTGQENFGLSYYRGELFVGTESGLRVYNATRNMKQGELIETHIPSGNPAITGIDFDMFGEMVYFSTPDSLYRLNRYVSWYIDKDNHIIRYNDRPAMTMEFMATGSNFADVSFGRSYGGPETDGLFILQKNSSDSKIYRVPAYDARADGEAVLTAYTKLNESINGMSATACGRMLLAAPDSWVMSDNTDNRLNFEDYTMYHFTNLIKIKKSELEPDTPSMNHKGHAAGPNVIFCLSDYILNDPDSEYIVEETVKLYRGDLIPSFDPPGRTIDGIHGLLMGSKFPWIGFLSFRDTFGSRNSYIQRETDVYLNDTWFRSRDYCAMPGKNDEQSIDWGINHNAQTGELDGEAGYISWLAAALDPLQKQNWLEGLRSPWMVRGRPWVQWSGYADQMDLANDDEFDLYSTGGRFEQILDDGEEYVCRVDGNMYNWFYYFIGNKHYCTDPEWKQIFRNIIAAYQGVTDDRPTPYFGCYAWGDLPDYEDYYGDTDQKYYIGDPLNPRMEVIDLESVHDLCLTGETFPAVASYLAYREGRMIRMNRLDPGFNYRIYPDLHRFGRFCRIIPEWVGSSADNINVGIAEVIKPGSLIETGYLNDVFKIDTEISTNTNNHVVLEFSELTPRRVLGSDDGVNWVSYGLQYSPYVFDNGAAYNQYRIEDPEGQHLNAVMENEFFNNYLNDWISSGDCTFTTVNPASEINIGGISAEIRVTPTSSLSESSLRQTIALSNDFTNTGYIVRGNGYISSDGSPGNGYLMIEWDTDSNPGNGVITNQKSAYMSSNNRFVEFRIDTIKPDNSRYMHVYYVVDPGTILAVNKRYIFDNMSIVRTGAPVTINNPSFEQGDISGWDGQDNGQMFSITSEPNEVMEGSYALRIKTGPEDHGLISEITNSFDISNDPVSTRYIVRAKVKVKKQTATVVKINGVYFHTPPATNNPYDERDGVIVEPNFDGDYVFTLRNTGRSDDLAGYNSQISIVIRVERAIGDINDIDEVIIDDIRIIKARAWPKPPFLKSSIY